MSAPEAMTYSSLVEDIKTYAERSDADFVAQIPRLVMLAEQRLILEAKNLGFVRVVEGNLAPTDPVLSKPDRWRQTKSFFIVDATGSVVYLKPRKYEYCRVYNAGQTPGVPEFYADYDYDHFYFALPPLSDYAFELSYYERPTPLSDATQTNWTTRYAPSLLLYACLLEAQPYLKNQGMLQLWQSQYAEIIASLQKEDFEHGHDKTEAGQ